METQVIPLIYKETERERTCGEVGQQHLFVYILGFFIITMSLTQHYHARQRLYIWCELHRTLPSPKELDVDSLRTNPVHREITLFPRESLFQFHILAAYCLRTPAWKKGIISCRTTLVIPLYFRLPKITVNHLFIHKLLYGLGFAPNADLAIYTLTCYTHPYTFIHVTHTHSYMNIYTMPAYTLLPGCLDKSQCVLLRNTALIATHIHI